MSLLPAQAARAAIGIAVMLLAVGVCWSIAPLLGVGCLVGGIVSGACLGALRRGSRPERGLKSNAHEAAPPAQVPEHEGIEREQRVRETYLQAILDTLNDAGVFGDASRRVRMVNPAFTRLFGYTPEEIIGRETRHLFANPDEWDLMGERVRKLDSKPGSLLSEVQYRRKDGSTFWAESFGTPLISGEGSLLGYVGVHRDITERRHTQQQLEESLARLSVAQEAGKIGVFDWNVRTGIISLCPYSRKRFGIAESVAAVDRTIGEWMISVFPDDRPLVDAWIRETFANKAREANVDYRVVRGNGDVRWIATSSFVIYGEDGAPVRMVGANVDITERKLAEKETRDSEQRLKTVIESLEEGIIVVEPHALELRWNPAARKMFHYASPDESDRAFSAIHATFELSTLDGRILPVDEWPISRLVRGEIVRNVELRTRRKDLSWEAILSYGGVLVRDPSGSPLMGILTLLDVTSQKRYEQELVHAKDAADSANRAKSTFLSAMSHEIRTPLNSILGFGELLREPDLAPERREDYVNAICRNGEQLLALISDILDLSKIEADRVTVEREPVSPRSLLEDLQLTLSSRALQKDIDFHLEARTWLPNGIFSDETRLRQILVNVTGNAIKFTPGGGRVTVAVSFHRDPQEMCFDIIDTGIGVSREHWDTIFEPFHQADSTISRQFGGTGLGLALSRRLAQLLGGRLELVESRLGLGSTFRLTIPALVANEDELQPSLGAPQQAPPKPLAGLRILLAEDVPDNQVLAVRILSAHGASVDIVDDGDKAVEKALATPYDAVLMDVRMPRMDGHTATRILRAKGYRGPIIALSAHAMREEQMQSIEAGCDAHLSKPFAPSSLIAALKEKTSPARETLGQG